MANSGDVQHFMSDQGRRWRNFVFDGVNWHMLDHRGTTMIDAGMPVLRETGEVLFNHVPSMAEVAASFPGFQKAAIESLDIPPTPAQAQAVMAAVVNARNSAIQRVSPVPIIVPAPVPMPIVVPPNVALH